MEKIGISIYDPGELDLLVPKYKFDLVQAPFNLIDRRLYTSGWLQRLKDLGIEVHIRSAFLQGLLLMKRDELPSKFSPWSYLWDKWYSWQSEQDTVSAIEACLAFPLGFSQIDRVIVGADNVDHFGQIVKATKAGSPFDFPELQCHDEKLIHPKHWSNL